MTRVDRDFAGTDRISQTDILKATVRDDTGYVEPPKTQNDMDWDQTEASSGEFSPTIGDLMKLRQG